MGEIGSQPNLVAYWGSEEFPAWSARLVFPAGGIPDEIFRSVVITTAERLVPQHRYTGFITRDEQTGNVISFARTIYPRRKYPVTRPEECPPGMRALESAFADSSIAAHIEPDTARPGTYRTILGLYVGQQDSYDRPTEHSIEGEDGVRAKLRARGLGSTAVPAEVFTVRFTDTGTTKYTEPVADVRGPLSELGQAASLGAELGQERFTIERFYTDRPATVQMVETFHCKEPEFLLPSGTCYF